MPASCRWSETRNQTWNRLSGISQGHETRGFAVHELSAMVSVVNLEVCSSQVAGFSGSTYTPPRTMAQNLGA